MRFNIKVVAHLQGIEGAETVLVNESYAHRRHAEQMMLAMIGSDVAEDRMICANSQTFTDNRVDDRGREMIREITIENETLRKVFTLSVWK